MFVRGFRKFASLVSALSQAIENESRLNGKVITQLQLMLTNQDEYGDFWNA
jgi:hypothetical protein